MMMMTTTVTMKMTLRVMMRRMMPLWKAQVPPRIIVLAEDVLLSTNNRNLIE